LLGRVAERSEIGAAKFSFDVEAVAVVGVDVLVEGGWEVCGGVAVDVVSTLAEGVERVLQVDGLNSTTALVTTVRHRAWLVCSLWWRRRTWDFVGEEQPSAQRVQALAFVQLLVHASL